MNDTAEAIIEAIRTAFASVPRGAITIHEAEVIDSYGSEAERAAARRLDIATSWGDVADADIVACPNALPHLDPESWRFYIPAYMIWTLRNHRTHSSIVGDMTIYTLGLSHADAALQEYKLARFQLLGDAQARAVCRFLRYLVAHDADVDSTAASDALNRYWDRYCERPDG